MSPKSSFRSEALESLSLVFEGTVPPPSVPLVVGALFAFEEEEEGCCRDIDVAISPFFFFFFAAATPSLALYRSPSFLSRTISLFRRRICRLIVLYQWFLIALSVRPGSNFAISAHRFPIRACSLLIISSSSTLQGLFLMEGSRWFNHLVRHCFPLRAGPRCCSASFSAIVDHFVFPCAFTSAIIATSSALHHVFLSKGAAGAGGAHI